MILRYGLTLPGLILGQLKKWWWIYLIALIFMTFNHMLQSELPFMAKELGDAISKPPHLPPALSPFVFFAIGILIFRTLSRVLFFYPARVMEKELRLDLLKSLEVTPPFRIKDYSPGQIYQVIYSDIMQMRALIGFAFLQMGNVFIALIILVPKISQVHPKLLVAFSPLIIGIIFFTFMVKNYQRFYRESQDQGGEVQNFVIESFNGRKTIKNFFSEDQFHNLFQEKSFKELFFFYKAGIGSAFAVPIIKLGTGISLLYGAYLIKSLGMEATTLILFSGFVFLLISPLSFLAWIGVVFSRAYASWKRISELLESMEKEQEEEVSLLAKNQKLEENVFTLSFWQHQINLTFKPSTWTALVSETGQGKTYLLDRISYLYKSIGKDVAYVEQSPYLYNDTIAGNIFLGNENRDIKQAEKLLSLFDLTELAPLSQLLEMEVGENGKKVSGGQAKRIALIRSLMSGADILIWDDPFSSIDLILERKIISEIRESFPGVTIIFSSHRFTTVKFSDYCYYLDKSEGISEEGSMSSLLKKKGMFYEFFEGQMVDLSLG